MLFFLSSILIWIFNLKYYVFKDSNVLTAIPIRKGNMINKRNEKELNKVVTLKVHALTYTRPVLQLKDSKFSLRCTGAIYQVLKRPMDVSCYVTQPTICHPVTAVDSNNATGFPLTLLGFRNGSRCWSHSNTAFMPLSDRYGPHEREKGKKRKLFVHFRRHLSANKEL